MGLLEACRAGWSARLKEASGFTTAVHAAYAPERGANVPRSHASSALNGRLSGRSYCGSRLVCAAGLNTTAKALNVTGIDIVVRTSMAH